MREKKKRHNAPFINERRFSLMASIFVLFFFEVGRSLRFSVGTGLKRKTKQTKETPASISVSTEATTTSITPPLTLGHPHHLALGP